MRGCWQRDGCKCKGERKARKARKGADEGENEREGEEVSVRGRTVRGELKREHDSRGLNVDQ